MTWDIPTHSGDIFICQESYKVNYILIPLELLRKIPMYVKIYYVQDWVTWDNPTYVLGKYFMFQSNTRLKDIRVPSIKYVRYWLDWNNSTYSWNISSTYHFMVEGNLQIFPVRTALWLKDIWIHTYISLRKRLSGLEQFYVVNEYSLYVPL